VLTGDVHQHWAAEIKRTHDDAGSRAVGTEFVTTSVTSGGDGKDGQNDDALKENPHVKFNAQRRGYIRTRFTEKELRVDYRVLPYVSKEGAAASTAKTFVVEAGNPVLNSA
jgi:alkaline phosphatase D